MTASNTNGVIANASANLTAQQEKQKQLTPSQMMNAVLNTDATKKLLEQTCKENAGSFSASVLDLYSSDKSLQSFKPGDVFRECLKAASLKLPISKQLGFAYIVPYKGVPSFQIGYKGLIQLAQRTGAYKYINVGVVYDGEFKGEDKLSGAVDISGEKVSEEVIGYFAYIETITGFSKALYWSKDKVISHASRFSKSFQQGAAIWRDHFDEMAQKTILRNLLSKWGVMSVEMIRAEADDERAENADAMIRGTEDQDPAVYEGHADETSGSEEETA